MSEQRFNIKSTATELELYDNGVKIGEFPHFEWVARPVDYVINVLNEQQATIQSLDQENADLLGARIKAQEEWEKCTGKLKEKIVEQEATIEMYQRRVHKREEQISIIKKHCLKFLTDEQIEIIRKELEDE